MKEVNRSGEKQPIDNSSTLRKTLLQVAGKTLEFARDNVLSPIFNKALPVVFPLVNAGLVGLDLYRFEDHRMAYTLAAVYVLPKVILPIVKRINNPSLSKIINPEIINSQYFKYIQYAFLSMACLRYGLDMNFPSLIVGVDVVGVVGKNFLEDSDEDVLGSLSSGLRFALFSCVVVGAPYLFEAMMK